MFANLFTRIGFGKLKSEPHRWVVLDVETTGLDPSCDRLLAIAAIAIEVTPNFTRPSIILGDSYEAVLKQDMASNKDNILVHHIGVGAQTKGRYAVDVLEEFRDWVADSPLLAFHAPFDQGMINRAYRLHGLAPLKNDWIESRRSFSNNTYWDPNYMNWNNLKVLNDDIFIQLSYWHILSLILIIFSSLCSTQYNPLVSVGKL